MFIQVPVLTWETQRAAEPREGEEEEECVLEHFLPQPGRCELPPGDCCHLMAFHLGLSPSRSLHGAVCRGTCSGSPLPSGQVPNTLI